MIGSRHQATIKQPCLPCKKGTGLRAVRVIGHLTLCWASLIMACHLIACTTVLLAQESETPQVPANGSSASPEVVEFFEQKVRPLLEAKCFECHSSRSDKLKGGLKLDDRPSILVGGDNGPALVPGKPNESLLIKAIHYQEAGFEMPPDGKLRPNEIEVLEQWVASGAHYPVAAAPSKEKRVIDIELGKRHWAFSPIRASVPQTSDDAWSSQRLDSYIRAAQQQQKLSPLARATTESIVRRIKFDLVGLPPSFDEIDSVKNNLAPDALERYVDQLLASPQYGERWGRMWLELVRYCDVAESWAETQGNSYLYRDWVVAKLNEDIPFSEFSKLQLAADLMPGAQPADLAALGFIGLAPTYWKELQLPVEIIKMIVSDEIEERVHTYSSTFFGINMACARCHDHKVDPITNQDYYALAGVFASTRAADRALVAGVDSLKIFEARKQVEKWNAETKKLKDEIAKLDASLKKLSESTGEGQPVGTSEKLAEAEKNLNEKRQQLEKVTGQIQDAEGTPGYELALAPGALDQTLEVKEAVGTHGSRIIYNDQPKDAAIEIRGNPNKLGETVPRRYVSVLSADAPPMFTQGSGRLELADTMFAQSAPLVARVFVNRVWKLHFGVGLVDTPSDFGMLGAPPTHPELLDDLAQRFIDHQWSTKWLHREIVLSQTYQQLCRSDVDQLPTNASMWYVGAPLRRLDVEQWRDAMLLATGTLDLLMGGKPIELSQTDNHRRTLYGLVRRRELSDVLRLNDFPDPLTHSPQRSPTTTPLQQLYTLNSPFMHVRAKELADRITRELGAADNRQKIRRSYELLYAREPQPMELELGLEFLQQSGDHWEHYAQALLSSNEFYFIN